jgi:hypothetical protein
MYFEKVSMYCDGRLLQSSFESHFALLSTRVVIWTLPVVILYNYAVST